MMIQFSFLCLFFIRLLRLYNLFCPLKKGQFIIEKMITSLSKTMSENKEITVRCRFGLDFFIRIRESQFHQLLCYGVYEEAETYCFRNLLHEGDILFDIGANFGWYTILGAKIVGKNGQVHAFEPIPNNFNYLKRNMTISKHNNIITLNNFALGNKIGERHFHLFCDSAIGNASAFIADRDVDKSFLCKINLLDNYRREKKLEKVDFIKCDVEGFELKVLQGAKHLLSSEVPPIILIEINEKLSSVAGYNGINILQFLHEISDGRYTFYRIGQNRKINKYNMRGSINPIENILCIGSNIHREKLNRLFK